MILGFANHTPFLEFHENYSLVSKPFYPVACVDFFLQGQDPLPNECLNLLLLQWCFSSTLVQVFVATILSKVIIIYPLHPGLLQLQCSWWCLKHHLSSSISMPWHFCTHQTTYSRGENRACKRYKSNRINTFWTKQNIRLKIHLNAHSEKPFCNTHSCWFGNHAWNMSSISKTW